MAEPISIKGDRVLATYFLSELPGLLFFAYAKNKGFTRVGSR